MAVFLHAVQAWYWLSTKSQGEQTRAFLSLYFPFGHSEVGTHRQMAALDTHVMCTKQSTVP